MACILAVVAVLSLVAVVAEQRRVAAEAGRQLIRQTQLCTDLNKRLGELCEVEFVQRHLQKVGVAPYLLTASDRIAADISEVMSILGCDRDEAIRHIRRGVLGPESPERRSDG